MSNYKKIKSLLVGILIGSAMLMGCSSAQPELAEPSNAADAASESCMESDQPDHEEDLSSEAVATQPSTEITLSVDQIPEYVGDPYVVINDNEPDFLDTDLSTLSYEYYSELDSLGRCGVAYACVGIDLMPSEERGEIGPVKPSGWHTVKYNVVDGKYLYNRCHLIAYQLSGENANVNNLITGTRYMNVEGMLPFENMVADYVKETGNHVMYRVSPIFAGDNLVASGVQMEAKSVEDDGEGILFDVYCYNVQPGVEIDYATGDSTLRSDTADDTPDEDTEESDGAAPVMVWKSATGEKYHSINHCGNMNPDKATQITEEQAVNLGLDKCSRCW